MSEQQAFTPIRLSGRYLRRLEPARVAFLGLLVYIGLTLVAPLRVTITEFSVAAVAYALLCYLGLAVGAVIYHTIFPQRPGAKMLIAAPLPKPLFWAALAVSGLGVALRLIDRFVLRGVTLGEDAASVRTQLEGSSSSPISVVSAVTFPVCFGILFFYYCLPKTERRWWMGALATLIFLYPTFESVTSGTRSQMMVSLGMMLMIRSILVDDLKWLRNPALIALGAVLLLNLFFVMFEMRVESMGLDFYTSTQASGYAFTVLPNDFATSYLLENKGIMSSVVSLIVHLTQYYCHSGFEFVYIFDRLPNKPLLGAYNFFHIYKFIGMIIGDTSVNETINTLDIRVGVYATFFVPLYVDYNWGGPVFMMIFGFVLSILWRATLHHPTAWFPLTAYMSIVLFLMPVTSFIVSSQGLYIIVSLLALAIVIHRLDRRGRRLNAEFRKAQ